MTKKLFFYLLLLTTYNLIAQDNVGIGTTTPAPSSLLDMVSTNKGVLVPRMTAVQRIAISNPADALLVYDTDSMCFMYYKAATTTWTSLCKTASSGTSNDWSITGNSGTTAGTNFLGTTNSQDLVFKTNGSLASNERFRILQNGQSVYNKTTAQTNDVFSVYGSGTTGAINPIGTTAISGYVNNSSGIGVSGTNNNTTGGYGVYGSAQGNTGYGIYGTSTANGAGVYGINGSNGTGVLGINNNSSGSGFSYAVRGISSNSAFGFAIGGWNTHASGTGIIGAGNNVPTAFFPGNGAGAGSAFSGITFGTYAKAYSGSTSVTTAGGYFEDSLSAAMDNYAYVSAWSASTDFKIIGSGTNSTIVYDLNNQPVTMYSPEAPEILFEDYGNGQLTNGYAKIILDPVYVKNIRVNEKHPLRVFIQVEGDCNGVFVFNKTENGFEVKELNNGKSNISFTYKVVANRADRYVNGILSSKFEDVRFGKAPVKVKSNGVSNIFFNKEIQNIKTN